MLFAGERIGLYADLLWAFLEIPDWTRLGFVNVSWRKQTQLRVRLFIRRSETQALDRVLGMTGCDPLEFMSWPKVSGCKEYQAFMWMIFDDMCRVIECVRDTAYGWVPVGEFRDFLWYVRYLSNYNKRHSQFITVRTGKDLDVLLFVMLWKKLLNVQVASRISLATSIVNTAPFTYCSGVHQYVDSRFSHYPAQHRPYVRCQPGWVAVGFSIPSVHEFRRPRQLRSRTVVIQRNKWLMLKNVQNCHCARLNIAGPGASASTSAANPATSST